MRGARSIIQHLGDPHGVLVLDEPCFVKKGRHSAGVARQYTGTVGNVENCHIGVFLSYAGPLGHALLDRELYLPTAWTDDRARCEQAGIPADRPFATKPQLARQLLARAFAAGGPATWVTGDRVYGDDRRLRLWLEAQPQPYVLAVSGQGICRAGMGDNGRSNASWRPCRRTAGPASVPATGRKAPAGMTGAGCP